MGDFRWEARQHLDRAKELLARRDDASIRYACLELRLAIEYITYDQLTAYLGEVPNDAVKKWTPRDVIGMMLDIDPGADHTHGIAFGIQSEKDVPATEMQHLGEDKRFSIKWANKNHSALGNFLHAPTLYQIENGQAVSAEKIQQRAQDVVAELEKVLSSPIFHVNFGMFYEFKCECGTQIRRRSDSFKREDGIVCPNSKCGAIYDIVEESGNNFQFLARQADYVCRCGKTNYIGHHRLRHGRRYRCQNCGQRIEVRQMFEVHEIPDSGDE